MTRVALLVCLLAGAAEAAPCPRHAALARAANAAFPPEVRIDPIDPARLQCTAVRARRPLGLIVYDTGDGLLIALLSGTTALWTEGYVAQDSLRNSIESAEVADLDGDGVDEILMVSRHDGHEQSGGTTLYVMEPPGATADEVSNLGEVVLGERNGTMPIQDGGSICTSSWTLVRGPHRTRRIVTDGGCQGTRPDDFPIGRHVYALRGGEVVEVR